MYELQALQSKPQEILAHLELFEDYCMGKNVLTPEEYKALNIELSIGAVVHIGRKLFKNYNDGKHLIWISPDNKEHDMGLINNIDVFRDYPGFNRSRSLCLGKDMVDRYEVIEIEGKGNITRVVMEDGSFGIGPNYRMALRNAALKMHLTQRFNFYSIGGFLKNFVNPRRHRVH